LRNEAQSERAGALPVPVHKQAFDLQELVELGHGCRSFLYQQIAAKKLKARKRGRRTIVLRADLEAWVASLPVVEPRSAA
jgi:hypothetical protein